jgi:hypothetical protein
VRCGNIVFLIRHVVAEVAYEDLGRIMGALDVEHHPMLILNLRFADPCVPIAAFLQKTT